MQLVRSIKTLPNQPTGAKFRRKFIEIRDTPLLYEHLGGAGRELKLWAARHLPCAMGSPGSRLGGSLYGLEDCSRILFDKPHTQLTLPEQAILAASAKFQIILAPEDDQDGQCLSQEYWEKTVARALLMLDGKQGDPAFEAAKAVVMAMNIPTLWLPEGSKDLLADNRGQAQASDRRPFPATGQNFSSEVS